MKMINMEEKYAKNLKDILTKNPNIMQILKALKAIEPQAYIAAGIIRNTVWAHLHDQPYALENTEVDVIFYDVFDNYHAENLQKEMHRMIEVISKDPRCKKLSYDSMKDVFFMMKIAELQEQVAILKEFKQDSV